MELKIAMYPWFAVGHLTSFLHISNKLAQRRHRIFFFLPKSTFSKFSQFNLHPNRIHFYPITLPPVPGLPSAAETTADLPFPMYSLLRHAMDLTRPAIQSLLKHLNPHLVFFDFAHWIPDVARPLGIKSVHYCNISSAAVAFLFRDEPAAEGFKKAPEGFWCPEIRLRTCEARAVHVINNWKEFGSEMKFVERVIRVNDECDAIGFRSCREMEGKYFEFLEKRFRKPVILAGPVLPEPPNQTLDENLGKWLDQFAPKSVVFCAFGSEARLKSDQFQELLLGFELAGFPFLAALKPPLEANSVHDALPENFLRRIGKRGTVHGDWIQQQPILSHPSVGCFVTHCGWNSLSEAMVSECQLVLIPHVGDQWINARLMADDLKVGVEVERGDEDGLFTREGVAKAIGAAMDDGKEIGKEIRRNQDKWRDFLLSEGVENSYVDGFVRSLQSLLEAKACQHF